MKPRLIAIVVLVAVAALAAGLVYQRRESPNARRERLVEQFIAILPDSLDNDHILEIRHLFYNLYTRAEGGKVKSETADAITVKLADYVDKGRITPTDLLHFMAEVGYSTYKDDPHYTPDQSVDHPVLNPKAAMVSFGFDSTQYDSSFWAGYRDYVKTHPQEADSAAQR